MATYAYDFEVFKHNWLVVFEDVSTSETTIFIDDNEGLIDFYNKNKDSLFIGFNSKHYDDLIFKVLLHGGNAYNASKIIIEDDNKMLLYDMYDMFKYNINGIDLSQYTGFFSLKEIEGFMGMNIEETSVPFDLDRPLTNKEILNTLKYCKHDVKATIKLLGEKFADVQQKLLLIKEFNLSKIDVSKFNGGLTAKILKASGTKVFEDELNPYEPVDTLQIDHFKDVLAFYTENELNYSKTLEVDVYGVPHVFAWGGIHGAIPNFEYRGRMLQIDVGSYYPSMMIEYDFMSRQVPKKYKEQFKQIYTRRMRAKAKGDKKTATILKLVLNTVYGCLKDKYNKLYDPRMSNNVCITGQLLLLDLIENVSPYCKLVQSNTDGILVIPNNDLDESRLRLEVEKWEKRTRMTMEIDEADYIIQKDVNNYVLKEGEHIKVKGGLVKHYNADNEIKKSLRIIDHCIVDYFVYGIRPESTIEKYKEDLSMFQIIKKTGNMYYDRTWEYDGQKIPLNKCNRWYASNDDACGQPYQFKLRENNVVSKVKILQNAPQYPYLDNVGDFESSQLDKKYYADLAWSKIKLFKPDAR